MRVIQLILAVLLLTGGAFAENITVDVNGNGDFTTIQEAIDYSWDGDTVIVSEGTYDEQVHFNSRAIEVKSTDPIDPCVVEATIITGRLTFNFYEQEDSIINGLHIQGGVYCNQSDPTIKNNVITNGGGSGHGIESEGDTPTIIDNRIRGCTSYGIYRCAGLIQGNQIVENSQGIVGCNGEIKYNTLANNTNWGITDCGGLIKGNIVVNNLSHGLGYCHGTIEDNIISHNGNTSFSGGGLYECDGTIKNNIISGNKGNIGGGFYNCSGTIIDNTIVGNSAESGSAVWFSCDIFKNNIIAFNMATITNGGALYGLVYDEGYNCYWQNTNGNFGGGAYGIATDFYTDPWFAVNGQWTDPCNTPSDLTDDQWTDGDYHLKSEYGRWDDANEVWAIDAVTSRCIDAGDPCDVIGFEPQPNGGLINVGAYGGTEYASKSSGQGIPPNAQCTEDIEGDLNNDCQVNWEDFVRMSNNWLRCNWQPQTACE